MMFSLEFKMVVKAEDRSPEHEKELALYGKSRDCEKQHRSVLEVLPYGLTAHYDPAKTIGIRQMSPPIKAKNMEHRFPSKAENAKDRCEIVLPCTRIAQLQAIFSSIHETIAIAVPGILKATRRAKKGRSHSPSILLSMKSGSLKIFSYSSFSPLSIAFFLIVGRNQPSRNLPVSQDPMGHMIANPAGQHIRKVIMTNLVWLMTNYFFLRPFS
jgi:hypothetical protein